MTSRSTPLGEIGRSLNEAERASLEDFEREMRNRVIPAVIATMRRRAELAEINRRKYIGA